LLKRGVSLDDPLQLLALCRRADQYLPNWDERPFFPSVDSIIAAALEMMDSK
jgi:hypothetical protein